MLRRGAHAHKVTLYSSVSQTVGHAPLVGNRDVTGWAAPNVRKFSFYALYGNVRSIFRNLEQDHALD